MTYDTLIRQALIIDGSNTPGYVADVGLRDGRIENIGDLSAAHGVHELEAGGRVLAPGFIDVHTHDDTVVIRQPQMLPKLSQGVTTVIVGNCGISAAPVSLRGNPPDPMNLLGNAEAFAYPRFIDYRTAVEHAHPAVNVAALIGHTALRRGVPPSALVGRVSTGVGAFQPGCRAVSAAHGGAQDDRVVGGAVWLVRTWRNSRRALGRPGAVRPVASAGCGGLQAAAARGRGD